MKCKAVHQQKQKQEQGEQRRTDGAGGSSSRPVLPVGGAALSETTAAAALLCPQPMVEEQCVCFIDTNGARAIGKAPRGSTFAMCAQAAHNG